MRRSIIATVLVSALALTGCIDVSSIVGVGIHEVPTFYVHAYDMDAHDTAYPNVHITVLDHHGDNAVTGVDGNTRTLLAPADVDAIDIHVVFTDALGKTWGFDRTVHNLRRSDLRDPNGHRFELGLASRSWHQ